MIVTCAQSAFLCNLMVRSACADVEIGSGSLDISVAYHGFPIYSQSQDLCDKTACPVKKGPVKVALEEPFPIITPPVRIRHCSTQQKARTPQVINHCSTALIAIVCRFHLTDVHNELIHPRWSLILQGPYTVRITAKGKGNDAPQLFCLDVDFNVVPQGSRAQQNIQPESS